ncbi:hypothetical protein PGQ11_011912 [Apiospora arundinis]|uniref:Protein kinase domain-containing protein n=1 Tax=Apiospora arundinis TaxID=335852 RepID=A0ABR2I1W7_9PEZI
MATPKPNVVLSLVDHVTGGVTIRARVNDLIRYINVPRQLVVKHNLLHNADERDRLVLEREYPDGAKCLELHEDEFGQPALRPLDVILQGIKGIFYGLQLDYESFENVVPVSKPSITVTANGPSDRLCKAEHPLMQSYGKLILKIAELPDNLTSPDNPLWPRTKRLEAELLQELKMHRAVIELGLGIAPQIFGLVTEKGRGAIGYFMEYPEGSRTFAELDKNDGHKMTEDEKQACRDTLKKLHQAGFLHGDIHPGNLVRRADGSVMLIDYQATQRVSLAEVPSSTQEIERVNKLESWMNMLS